MRWVLWLFLFLSLGVSPARAGHDVRTMIIGVPPNSAPLSYLNDEGTALQGLAVELCMDIGHELEMDVAFRRTNARKLEQMLARGEIDAIAALLPSDHLHNDFSDLLVTPLALNRAILVYGLDKQFTSEEDLRNHKVLFIRGDSYKNRLEELGSIPVQADSITNALNALQAGKADAYVTSSIEMAYNVIQKKNFQNVRMVGGSLERIPMVLMVGKRSGLLERMTGALVRLEASGEVEKLRGKWLGRLLSPKSLWEEYRHVIVMGIAVLAALGLLTAVWIRTLRSQVRRVSHKLMQSELKYRRFIEESPDIILLFDEHGTIQLANPAARHTLKMEAHASGSAVLMDALCSETQGCLESFLSLIPPKGSLRREITLFAGTDQEQTLEAVIFSAGIDLPAVSTCLIGRDMTERRRIDRRMMEMDRMAILGKLAAGVAHEINNPVGIIMSNAQLALEDCDEGTPMRSMLRAIIRNGERAIATTRRLLNIALPNAVEFEPQDLTGIILDSLFFLRPRLKNTAVDAGMLPGGLFVLGNRIMLEQLFLNLFINALDSMDATDCAQRALVVEGRCMGGKIVLDVADTGNGIDAGDMGQIFDPFFSTKGTGGFGLGLYISRHIMELHKGEISAESEPGSGAVLSLQFPAMQPTASAHGQP